VSLFLIVLLPFAGALLPGLLIRAGRNVCAATTGAVTATALLGLIVNAPAVMRGQSLTARLDWLPALGLNANFHLDGLGLLFAGLILGIGLLIILYARFYLSREDPMGRFYTFLLLFQGAMVGIVLSDNILLLLVFWELTSLSSFLLIGYWSHLPESRQGARMALTVTGTGGLAMIAGMLILGNLADSYDLSVILTRKETIQASSLYPLALVLILAGCFTKSAQFPFHFWLPHAMAAPTPVSAYLHSATMVKAGLFLMARLWPVLSGTPEWFYIVATTGLVTMVLGALIALFKDDLKALLAFSTVSHLGLITMLLGFGTKGAAVAAVFHIINHASFKAALFMTAGIIDHETHTRDAQRLGGLRRLMPVTFAIATITALSMAGLPFLNGFLSKEMMLEEAAHTAWLGNPWLVPALATAGALLSVAYSLRYLVHVFLGPERDDYPTRPHDPGFGMWAAPALLVVPVIVIGIYPAVAEALVNTTATAVIGQDPHVHLKIWHGLTPALFLSVVAVAGGALLLSVQRPLARLWDSTPRPEAKTMFDAAIAGLAGLGNRVTDGLHNGAITRYAAIFMVTVVAVGWHAYGGGALGAETRALSQISPVAWIGWAVLVIATLGLIRYHRNRLRALVLMGVIGLIVSISFNYLSAPDLALTQLSVEVVTIILLLLALNFLPEITPPETPPLRRMRDMTIAAAAGLGAGGLIYLLMTRDFVFGTISDFHLTRSYKGGGGDNVVNVILVDFRGYDTFGEITVLGIAAIVIYAVTEALLDSPVRRRLLHRQPGHALAGDAHPMMMVIGTRVLMPIALMVAAYIFLRGHNQPGGGFIAGLVASIALVMQYMASGFAWASERQRYPYHGIIAAGVLLATATGVGSWLADRPFLTSNFGYFRIPPLKEFELATAMGFDAGVFLVVVGAVMLALESISRMARRQDNEVSPYPMDIDPARETTPAKET